MQASVRKRRRPDALDALVERIIKEADVPIGAYEISERTAHYSDKLAPTQVYRSVSRLIESGRIAHLVSLNAYVSCQQKDAIHLLCPKCHNHWSFAGKAFRAELEKLCASVAFDCHGTHIELTGHCPDCRSGQSAAS